MGEPFKAVLVMDLRAPRFVEMFPRLYDELVQKGYNLELLFLEAGDAGPAQALLSDPPPTSAHLQQGRSG